MLQESQSACRSYRFAASSDGIKQERRNHKIAKTFQIEIEEPIFGLNKPGTASFICLMRSNRYSF